MSDNDIQPKQENNENFTSEQDVILDKTFFKEYLVTSKIGEGAFGRIYKAKSISDNEFYALKFEYLKDSIGILENEAAILQYLKGPNIPYIKTFGISGGYNVLVMQLLGQSLGSLLERPKTFFLKTVCLLAIQIITILEYIHNKHIVHRDIKPKNFVMGRNKNSPFLYIIDFGLAKKFRSSKTLIHFPLIKRKNLVGTARYASINAMKGWEQSRRDDLESVGYMLIYFLKGVLPWQELGGENKKEKFEKILKKKSETTSYELCYGFPNELEEYFDYCKSMEYEDEPDYEMLRNIFIKILKKQKWEFDYIYDWSTKEDIELANQFLSENGKEILSIKEDEEKNKYYYDNRPLDVGVNNENRFDYGLNYENKQYDDNAFEEEKSEEKKSSEDKPLLNEQETENKDEEEEIKNEEKDIKNEKKEIKTEKKEIQNEEDIINKLIEKETVCCCNLF